MRINSLTLKCQIEWIQNSISHINPKRKNPFNCEWRTENKKKQKKNYKTKIKRYTKRKRKKNSNSPTSTVT